MKTIVATYNQNQLSQLNNSTDLAWVSFTVAYVWLYRANAKRTLFVHRFTWKLFIGYILIKALKSIRLKKLEVCVHMLFLQWMWLIKSWNTHLKIIHGEFDENITYKSFHINRVSVNLFCQQTWVSNWKRAQKILSSVQWVWYDFLLFKWKKSHLLHIKNAFKNIAGATQRQISQTRRFVCFKWILYLYLMVVSMSDSVELEQWEKSTK